MCEDATDCQNATSPYYQYVNNGLDQALKQLFYSVESLMLQNFTTINLHNPTFKFIYEVCE
jgi:hypothetical protein